MRILRFEHRGKVLFGSLDGQIVRVLKGNPVTAGVDRIEMSGEEIPLSEVKILMPVEKPRQIIAIGLNYKEHIAEFEREPAIVVPEFPITFMIGQSALASPEEEIYLPSKENRIDYEAELVAIIGKEAYQVEESQALDYVFGYTCGNDISDRNVQKKDVQWTRAKSYPGFKPIGPWIETELDPSNLQITSRVNGEVCQSSKTSMMIFPIKELIAKLSSFMKLYPGDLIFSGTPEGVGPLKEGDICEIEVEGIGVLRNFIR